MLKVTPEAFANCVRPFFASDADFEAFVASVRERSLYSVPLNVKPTDALLTLSTCVDDDRLVIFARKLRAGETKDEIVSAVEQSVRVA